MDVFKKHARKALGGLWWQEMRHLSASDRRRVKTYSRRGARAVLKRQDKCQLKKEVSDVR